VSYYNWYHKGPYMQAYPNDGQWIIHRKAKK
jgi:hypothetical protein